MCVRMMHVEGRDREGPTDSEEHSHLSGYLLEGHYPLSVHASDLGEGGKGLTVSMSVR